FGVDLGQDAAVRADRVLRHAAGVRGVAFDLQSALCGELLVAVPGGGAVDSYFARCGIVDLDSIEHATAGEHVHVSVVPGVLDVERIHISDTQHAGRDSVVYVLEPHAVLPGDCARDFPEGIGVGYDVAELCRTGGFRCDDSGD